MKIVTLRQSSLSNQLDLTNDNKMDYVVAIHRKDEEQLRIKPALCWQF